MGIGGSDMYRQQILDHYKNPRNYGEIEDPTFSHVGENPMCGERGLLEFPVVPGVLVVIEDLLSVHVRSADAHRRR